MIGFTGHIKLKLALKLLRLSFKLKLSLVHRVSIGSQVGLQFKLELGWFGSGQFNRIQGYHGTGFDKGIKHSNNQL